MPTHALQYWRLSANLSPQELAQRANLSDRLIKNIEADPEYNIKFQTAKAIANALNLPMFIIFMPEEHELINEMLLEMANRQEATFNIQLTETLLAMQKRQKAFFNLQTMFSMRQKLPPHRQGEHAAAANTRGKR